MKNKGVDINLSMELVKKMICYLWIGKMTQHLDQQTMKTEKVNDMIHTKTNKMTKDRLFDVTKNK